jgi:hypothetical protein
MSDLDLFVRQADLARIEAQLLELGYAPQGDQALLAQEHYHFPYVSPDTGICVELHWNLHGPAYPFQVGVDGLWERSRHASVAGVELSVLEPEDLLLYLCLHTCRHVLNYTLMFLALRSYLDVAETVQHEHDTIDWEKLVQRARQWGIAKCVYLMLRLSRELLQAAVPESVLAQLAPAELDPGLVRWVKEQVFAEPWQPLNVAPVMAPLREADRLHAKLLAFLKMVFPAPDQLAQMYGRPPHEKRIYWYYAVRLKDLAVRSMRAGWQLLHRDPRTRAELQREIKADALIEWLASP